MVLVGLGLRYNFGAYYKHVFFLVWICTVFREHNSFFYEIVLRSRLFTESMKQRTLFALVFSFLKVQFKTEDTSASAFLGGLIQETDKSRASLGDSSLSSGTNGLFNSIEGGCNGLKCFFRRSE